MNKSSASRNSREGRFLHTRWPGGRVSLENLPTHAVIYDYSDPLNPVAAERVPLGVERMSTKVFQVSFVYAPPAEMYASYPRLCS